MDFSVLSVLSVSPWCILFSSLVPPRATRVARNSTRNDRIPQFCSAVTGRPVLPNYGPIPNRVNDNSSRD